MGDLRGSWAPDVSVLQWCICSVRADTNYLASRDYWPLIFIVFKKKKKSQEAYYEFQAAVLKLWAHRTALAVHREFTGAAGYKLFGHRLRSLSYCGFASLRSLPYVNSTIQPEEDIAKSKHCLHRVNSLIQQLMDQYIYLSTVSYRMGQVKTRRLTFENRQFRRSWKFVDMSTLV